MITRFRSIQVACLVWVGVLVLPSILLATGPAIAARDSRPSLYDRNRRDTDNSNRGGNTNRRGQTSSNYMPTAPYYSFDSSLEDDEQDSLSLR